MEPKRIESRLGRFSYLFKGRARPRRSLALMMALVLVGMLSLAGVVSADSAWTGQPPVTNLTGALNGGLDIQFGNTWKTDNPIDNDNTTANLTLAVNPSCVDIQFARLYVVVYTANNTANWRGAETIQLDHGGTVETLTNEHPLDLNYVNTTSGMVCNSSISAPPFTSTTNGLCRVMSDYVSIFDVKDYLTTKNINVSILTKNVSDRFDGRVKEVKLIYGWNVTTTNIRYWINEGHDPSTGFDPGYQGVTSFNDVDTDGISSATLYTDDIASASGQYAWGYPTAYITPTTLASNSYARINRFTIIDPATNVSENNDFYYDRYGTNTYYKLAVAVLKLTY